MSEFHDNIRLTHLSKGDAHLFRKFYDLHGKRFFDYKFDVRVGHTTVTPKGFPAWVQSDAAALSRKRIDVTMVDKKNIYLLELRVDAKANVIGDLISYRFLYMGDFHPNKPIIPMLVSNSIEPDLLVALNELGLLFYIV